MRRLGGLAALGALAATGLTAPATAGPEWVEGADAGSLPGSSQQTSGKEIGRIVGRLDGNDVLVAGGGDFEDMYLITIASAAEFCATTVFDGGFAEFPSALYLFEVTGDGLIGNVVTPNFVGTEAGKTGEGGQSTITSMTTDGTNPMIVDGELYLLAITVDPNEPVSNTGPIFSYSSFDEVSGADGIGAANPIVNWMPPPAATGGPGNRVGGGLPDPPGDYIIALCGVEGAIAVGACCLAVDECQILTEEDCGLAGGSYQDDDSICATPTGPPTTFNSSPNAAIPDDGGTTSLTDTVNVVPDFIIGDVDVAIDITHTWNGDLQVELEFDGTTVVLYNQACAFSEGIDAIFNDEGAAIVCGDPVQGNIDPFQANGTLLSAFDGKTSAGAWNLTVTDLFSGDEGTLVSWTLAISPGDLICDDFIEVPVDIKPGGCPNSFNRNSNGVLPVAVLGTDTFDVSDIDLSTVVISRADGMGGSIGPNEGPPGPHSVYTDVATPFGGAECDCHDLDGDGHTDLSMKFRSSPMVDALEMDDLDAGALVPLEVSGLLNNGTPFVGVDCVRLVPPGTPPGQMCLSVAIPGAWTDASPLDLALDGGGFGSYERTYPQLTVVTLTAEPEFLGRAFLGWRIEGGPLINQLSIPHVIAGAQQMVEAVYEAPPPVGGPITPDNTGRGGGKLRR